MARCSLGSPGSFYSEELLYELFGVNAELLIDHAWGYEPCTMAQIKAYRPETSSLSSGQVLHEPYPYEKAELIVKEMTDLLILDLVDKALLTDQIVLTIGYDIENLTDPERRRRYHGPVVTDPYGRKVPKHSHGTENFPEPTASEKHIMEAVLRLYRRIADPDLLVRRITLAACHLIPEQEKKQVYQQLDIFTVNVPEGADCALRKTNERDGITEYEFSFVWTEETAAADGTFTVEWTDMVSGILSPRKDTSRRTQLPSIFFLQQ